MEQILTETIDQDELTRFEQKYNQEIRAGTLADGTQFEYAWSLVRSDFPGDMKKGIALFIDLCTRHPEGRRDYIYYLAVGFTRLKEYANALKYVQAFLEIEPNNQQVIALEEIVKKRIDTENMKDVAKAVGGVMAVGAALAVVYNILKH